MKCGFNSCCGVFCLESGIVLLSAAFMSLAYTALVVNVTDCLGPAGHISNGMLVFLGVYLLSLVSLVAVIAAVYKDNQALLNLALGGYVVLTLVWTVTSLLSIFGSPYVRDNVCIKGRCSETFWIALLHYKETLRMEELDMTMPMNATEPVTEPSTLPPIEPAVESVATTTVSTTVYVTAKMTEFHDKRFGLLALTSNYGNQFGVQMVAAISIFATILFCLLLMIVLIWSYKKEVKVKEDIDYDGRRLKEVEVKV